MTLPAGFVHNIDPVVLTIGRIPLYWYGFAYSLGFTGMLAWFLARRRRIGLERGEAYELCILIVIGVLVGGRAFEIVIYEWDYYRAHSTLLLSYWHGGMASHGVLVGAAIALWLFSRWRRYPYLLLADEMVIPGALFLALGRIGNFINGQIVGYPTDAWWGVLFAEFEGYRHPVALYESLKNLALVPILLLVRRRYSPGCGLLLAHFLFWYGFLRLFSDYFREYGVEFLGIGRGQYFNLLMALIGLGLIWLMKRRQRTGPGKSSKDDPPLAATLDAPGSSGWPLRIRQLIFVALVLFCLVIPSSWTKGAFQEIHNAAAGAGEVLPALWQRSMKAGPHYVRAEHSERGHPDAFCRAAANRGAGGTAVGVSTVLQRSEGTMAIPLRSSRRTCPKGQVRWNDAVDRLAKKAFQRAARLWEGPC